MNGEGENSEPRNPAMTHEEQCVALADSLDDLLNQYMNEWDLTYSDIIGALQLKLHMVCTEAEQLAHEENNNSDNYEED